MAKTETATKFDVSTLTVEDVAELPKGTRTAKPNPLNGLVASSGGSPKRLANVPEAEVKTVISLLRRAASEQGIGIKVRETSGDNGAVNVLFQTKEKRAYTQKSAE